MDVHLYVGQSFWLGDLWFKGLMRAFCCAGCYNRLSLIFERILRITILEPSPCLLQPHGKGTWGTIVVPLPLSRKEGVASLGCWFLPWAMLGEPTPQKGHTCFCLSPSSVSDYMDKMSPGSYSYSWLGEAIQVLFSRLIPHSAPHLICNQTGSEQASPEYATWQEDYFELKTIKTQKTWFPLNPLKEFR